jgi:hypothetical protein
VAPLSASSTAEPVFTEDPGGVFRFGEPAAPSMAESGEPSIAAPPVAYAVPPTVSPDPVASSLSAIEWAAAAPTPAPHGYDVPGASTVEEFGTTTDSPDVAYDADTADTPEADAVDEWNAAPDDGEPVFSSAASMATEILSATPESPFVAAPETSGEPDLISKDLTLIARGRRKRFRLR